MKLQSPVRTHTWIYVASTYVESSTQRIRWTCKLSSSESVIVGSQRGVSSADCPKSGVARRYVGRRRQNWTLYCTMEH